MSRSAQHGAFLMGEAGKLSALAPLLAWWRELAARERRLAWTAASVVVLGLTWALAVQPAWRTIARAEIELEMLENQLQTMQGLAVQARQLRMAPTVAPDQVAAALKSATDRLGEQGKLVVQGERAVLTVTGVGTAALRDWLAEARAGARARPLEAKLTRTAKGYSGTLVLAVGGAP